MSYMEIENLYKDLRILQFKECYAMEKIHGTSAHVTFKDENLIFFSGGDTHDDFVAHFNQEDLKKRFTEKGMDPNIPVTIYGENYGGKIQKMSNTYGKEKRFVVFEVKIGDTWLNVFKAEKFTNEMGLQFVDYMVIPATIEDIEKQMIRPSSQAIRNGMGDDKMREGVVLRPLEEYRDNRGNRIITKHKNPAFSEVKTPREIDPEKLQIIEEANAIAEEWVTHMRLIHVLDNVDFEIDVKNTGQVIQLMIDDVLKESKGEIVDSPAARKAISRATALLFKRSLQIPLGGSE